MTDENHTNTEHIDTQISNLENRIDGHWPSAALTSREASPDWLRRGPGKLSSTPHSEKSLTGLRPKPLRRTSKRPSPPRCPMCTRTRGRKTPSSPHLKKHGTG